MTAIAVSLPSSLPLIFLQSLDSSASVLSRASTPQGETEQQREGGNEIEQGEREGERQNKGKEEEERADFFSLSDSPYPSLLSLPPSSPHSH